MAGYIGSKAVLLSTTAATVTGDMTVDTSTLKVDSSNNRVGIGTASPTSALHVSGGAGTNIAIQSSAGTHWRIGDGVGSTNGNLVIYDYSDSRKVFEIDTLGHVTMPSQPAFSVTKSGHQSNLSSGLTTITFDTERFDQNGDFASNTFTAPVTGRYQLSFNLYLDGITQASNYYQANLATSNRKYYFVFDPDFGQNNVFWNLNGSLLVEMDAGDTATIEMDLGNDVDGTNDINAVSSFHGFLAC